MRRLMLLALLLALAGTSVALAATKTVKATESHGLGYSKKTITVGHGKVTLKMVNPDSLHLEHSISIRGHGVSKKGKIVPPGGTSKVTATLAKGSYTFYCHVEGHEAEGMKGTLKVN